MFIEYIILVMQTKNKLQLVKIVEMIIMTAGIVRYIFSQKIKKMMQLKDSPQIQMRFLLIFNK